jgi:rhodanese-related sulfurtransferase
MFEHEHLEGAVSLPLATFEASYPKAAPSIKGKVAITYAGSSSREAEKLARKLRAKGERAFLLDGGLSAWSRQGLPTVTARPSPSGISKPTT